MARLIIIAYIIATSSALILLKLGSKTGHQYHILTSRIPFTISILSLGGMVLYGISFLLYIYLIRRFDLGYIIPLTTAFVYIIIFGASFLIFKESFTIFKVVGITCIVTGLIFLNINK